MACLYIGLKSIICFQFQQSKKKKKKKKEKTTKRDEKENLLVCDASLLFRGIRKSLFCFGVSSTGPLYAKEVEGGKACNYS